MQLPEWIRTMFLVTTGDGWPEADEDQLRALAREWSTVAGTVVVLRQCLDESARAGRGREWHGPAAVAFSTAEDTLTGPGGQHLNVLAQGAEDVAAFVDDTSARVQYLKLIVLGQLLMLAGEIAYLIAIASMTFGASTTAIPALQHAGRAFALTAMRGLVIAIAAGQVLQVGLDASVQALQKFVLHTRRDWDTTLTGMAAVAGAVGGALAPAVGALGAMAAGRALRQVAGKTITAGVRHVGTGAVHEYATGVGTGVVTGRGATGSGWDLSAGATDSAGGLLRRGRPGPAPIILAGEVVGAPDRPAVSWVAGDPTTAPSKRWRVDLMRPEPLPPLTVTVQAPQAVTAHATLVDPAAEDGAAANPVAVWAPAEFAGFTDHDGALSALLSDDQPPSIEQVLRGLDPLRDVPHAPVPVESSSAWSADGRQEFGPVDLNRPMIVSRRIDSAGRVSLGSIKRGATENPFQCRFFIGGGWSGEWVDVRFGDGGMSVLGKDSNGQDAVIEVDNHRMWDLTRGEFSRFPGARYATDAEVARSAIDQVSRGIDRGLPRQEQRSGDGAGKRSAEQAGLDGATGSSSRQGQYSGNRHTAPSGLTAPSERTEPAGPHNVWNLEPAPQPSEVPTTTWLSPHAVDPNQPMVITRNVDTNGRVFLGYTRRGHANKPIQRQPHIDKRRAGESVDVRFDDTGLSVIADDGNGRDVVIKRIDANQWDLTREEFSKLSWVYNTTAPLPPPMVDPVDPNRPMAVTRKVGANGYVGLGYAQRGDPGRPYQCRLYLGIARAGMSVDISFADAGLFITAKDSNGQDRLISSTDRRKWNLTREEFSRFTGVHNTAGLAAVSPSVTSGADEHPVPAIDQVLRGADPRREVPRLAGEVHTATAPRPPRLVGSVDPTRPMVITRKVDKNGCVSLGTRQDGTGKRIQRQLHVGKRWIGRSVDIRLVDPGVVAIVRDGNGQDAVIQLGSRRTWELTREEFARLTGVHNTTAPLPPLLANPVDPNRPMAVTRKVAINGHVTLGQVKQGTAGFLAHRKLEVGRDRVGELVDVHFGDTVLTITGRDGDNPSTTITAPYPPMWELTRDEFSRLVGVRNTADANALSPAATTTDPFALAGTLQAIVAGALPAIDEHPGLAEAQPDDGGMPDEGAMSPWWDGGISSWWDQDGDGDGDRGNPIS